MLLNFSTGVVLTGYFNESTAAYARCEGDWTSRCSGEHAHGQSRSGTGGVEANLTRYEQTNDGTDFQCVADVNGETYQTSIILTGETFYDMSC